MGDSVMMRSLRQRFKYYDKDGDGKLSASQVLAMLEEEKQPEGLDGEVREGLIITRALPHPHGRPQRHPYQRPRHTV